MIKSKYTCTKALFIIKITLKQIYQRKNYETGGLIYEEKDS